MPPQCSPPRGGGSRNMSKTSGGRRLGVMGTNRRAMMRNVATSLFLHEKLTTTISKAKTLRPYAEKLITHAVHGKHFLVRRHVQDKGVQEAFRDPPRVRQAARQVHPHRPPSAPAGRPTSRGVITLVTWTAHVRLPFSLFSNDMGSTSARQHPGLREEPGQIVLRSPPLWPSTGRRRLAIEAEAEDAGQTRFNRRGKALAQRGHRRLQESRSR